MALRRTRVQDAQLSFEALLIEGGLLSPEWLAKIAALAAPGQTETEYRVPKGLNLRDEIGRYWRIAQAQWTDFTAGRRANADPKKLTEAFVAALLREVFGFVTLLDVPPIVIGGRTYPIGCAGLGGRVPVVTAPFSLGLEAASVAFGDGSRRRSAFGCAQEYLNAQEGALWGLATNGVTLRILRDNASLTRPSWIEADLARIFTEERYADFAALWLLCHETRFGRAGQPVTDCALETWRNAGREEGTRAREHLRRGVEDALIALGQGFLAHPENTSLRAELREGTLSTMQYFNQLLRLVYRLIFLLTIEERELLHPPDASPAGASLYKEGYGLRRLRERAVKRSAHDRSSDLWESIKIVMRGLAHGEPRLGLPALAGIFGVTHCSALDHAKLENRFLLLAMFKLAWLRDNGSLVRVNWRDMGPEELGSVYESLLELVPRITKEGRQFEFASGDDTKGHARKTTGSYYTPDSLVQVLLDSALEPVIEQATASYPEKRLDALLNLTIVDPACGSGHFLLAAARRLASHIARLAASGTPSAADYRHALRQVIGRCLYGVDQNPLAVELCKVSLWMEAIEPGLPLTFLNSHIQQGNALLGTTPELMAKGIPDAAWEPIEGDDRKIASGLKKRNKKAAQGQRTLETLWSTSDRPEAQALVRAIGELESSSDASPEGLAKKETQWDQILESGEYRHQQFVADAWCAAFVWPKTTVGMDAAPVNDLWRQLRDKVGEAPSLTRTLVEEISREYHFFHWHLQFPHVFGRGGFDVVLGNPPWERMKLQEQEFFASRDEEIAKAPNASARKLLITRLPDSGPELWNEWMAASRRAEGESHLVRHSGRYPLCGRGDVNSYAVFAEHNRSILGPFGRAGFIVPTGIATDDTTKEFFGALVANRELASLYDFQSGPGLFGDIGHARFKFSLFTLGKDVLSIDFVFFARNTGELSVPDRHFTLVPSDFATLNPNTRTCPTFRSQRDAEINLAIYRRTGVLWREGEHEDNSWGLRFMAMLHMANDSHLFRTQKQLEATGHRLSGNRFVGKGDEYLPLIEAKMVHHYDHRYGDYSDKPANSDNTSLPDVPLSRLEDPTYWPKARYYVKAGEVDGRLNDRWAYGWLLGFRDICRSSDERTVIASLMPRAAVGNKFPLIFPTADARLISCLYANLCSFVLDYCSRQKVGGTSLTYFIVKQLPILSPNIYRMQASWCPGIVLEDWFWPRILELTYTAWGLEPFASDVACDGPPFRWDSKRRFMLRCEIDAAFFHLYGICRNDLEYIMETFPIVRKNEQKAHGEYRTKRVILEVYDAMAEAARTGQPYQTCLDPPPADPRVAHPRSGDLQRG